jgi:hypothetical protein
MIEFFLGVTVGIAIGYTTYEYLFYPVMKVIIHRREKNNRP